MRRHKQTPLWLFVLVLLSGCQSGIVSLYSEGLPSTASWSILPFINLSPAGGVSPRVERMVAVLLPSAGVKHPTLYRGQGPNPIEITGRPAQAASNLYNTSQVVLSQPSGFAVGGEIEAWFIDGNGRPHVSLSLHVNDVGSGSRLWDASGSRKGLAGESIYEVSRALITDLLMLLPVNRGQQF